MEAKTVDCYKCDNKFPKDQGFTCKLCAGDYTFCSHECLMELCEHERRNYDLPEDGEYEVDCKRCATEGAGKNDFNGMKLCDHCVLHKMGVFGHGGQCPGHARSHNYKGDCGSHDCTRDKKVRNYEDDDEEVYDTGSKCVMCENWFCKYHVDTFVLGVCHRCRL